MSGKAAKIVITERQEEILRSLVRGRTTPRHVAQRAEIILLGFARWKNEQVAEQVGLGRHAVGLWRRRWSENWNRLAAVECSDTRAALERAVVETLSDAPRPGSPGTFAPEQITQILALACEPPEKSGRPITHWTPAELAGPAATDRV